MASLNIQALAQIQGCLMAAHDDCQSEECGAREGDPIDVCMIDGAIFHAEDAVRKMKLLRDSLLSVEAL